MKLITFFLIVGLMQVSASAYSQFLKVEFPQNSISVKDVLLTIEKNSEYKFLYRNDQMDVNRLVEIKSSSNSLDNILSQVLDKTNLSYKILENNLVVITTEQQKSTVSGKVTDNTGQPLVGVTVSVTGSTRAVISDGNGKYSITLNANDKTLSYSFIGMKKQDIAIEGRTVINVVLETETSTLEEVVVVGYGTQKKSDVTGSLTSISEKTLRERPVQNAIQAMQGKAAGVDIVSNVRPGEVSSVSIRGTRSITASSAPLYVVDGIILFGSINDINPNDIAHMEILKDASATAIYGSRGANGVILITTKKGSKGQLAVNYDASVSLENIHSTMDWASSGETMDRMRLAEINGGTYKTGTTSLLYPDPTADINKYGNSDYYTIAAIRKGYQWTDATFSTPVTRASTPAELALGWPAQVPVYNSANIPTTNWVDLLTRQSVTQNHLLSLSAGNETSRIYFSFGYLNNEGTQTNQNYNRYTIKLNGDITPLKWLTAGASVNASLTSQEYGNINRSGSATGAKDSYGVALSQYRMARPYDSIGTMILYPGNNKAAPTWNPFIDLQNSSDETKTFNLQANAFTEVSFTPWLKYRMNFGSGFRSSRVGTWQGTQSTLRRTGSPQTALDSYNTSLNQSYMIENLLYFDKTFGVHAIGATLLQSAQDIRNENSAMTASGVTNDAPRWYDLAANNSSSGPDSYGTGFSETTLTSYMGRLNYSLLNKYLLTATGRFDGASVLAKGHKWDFFPSLAFAWKMQEEKFIKSIKWITELKLRAGYGVTGNSSVNPYTTSGPLTIYKYVYGTASAIGYLPYNMPNPNLTWERTEQINFGFDFALLYNRLTGTIDLYQSNTTNVILNENIPSITGYPFITANIGQIRNTGIEISIASVNIRTKDFHWTTNINWSTNKEEFVSLVNGKQDMVGNNWFIGQPTQVFRTYQVAGLWGNTADDLAEIAKWAANGYTFTPGQYKPVEQGTPNYKLEDADKVIRGTNRPKWIGGLTNTFTYKNMELSAFIYARIGQSYFSSLQPGGSGGGAFVGYVRTMDPNNFWSPTNLNAQWPQPTTNPKASNADVNRAMFINDGSFVSVRNISLTYNLEPQILEKLKIKNLQVYCQILNPFLFGGAVVKSGINPDDTNGWTSVNSVGDSSGGTNSNTMILKSWVFGIRVSL